MCPRSVCRPQNRKRQTLLTLMPFMQAVVIIFSRRLATRSGSSFSSGERQLRFSSQPLGDETSRDHNQHSQSRCPRTCYSDRGAGRSPVPWFANLTAIAIVALLLAWWVVRITPSWVKIVGDAYAQRLLASIDEL